MLEAYMKRKLIRLLALSSLLVAGNTFAEGFALGAKAGTLGLGVEGTFGLFDHLNLRAGINSYSRSFDQDASGITYKADFDLKTGAVIFDFHPFAGTFRLSAGLIYNNNGLHLSATPTNNVTIGNTTYTPAQAGTITGDVSFKKTAPYIGLGWGNAVKKGSPFGFTAEIGAMLQGSPNVRLSSNSPFVSQNDLRQEEQQADSDLNTVYPVISLGFSYRF
jgi:hypothetical protein